MKIEDNVGYEAEQDDPVEVEEGDHQDELEDLVLKLLPSG
jgi:hypothetical protein